MDAGKPNWNHEYCLECNRKLFNCILIIMYLRSRVKIIWLSTSLSLQPNKTVWSFGYQFKRCNAIKSSSSLVHTSKNMNNIHGRPKNRGQYLDQSIAFIRLPFLLFTQQKSLRDKASDRSILECIANGLFTITQWNN
jgi:hypothetical protein